MLDQLLPLQANRVAHPHEIRLRGFPHRDTYGAGPLRGRGLGPSASLCLSPSLFRRASSSGQEVGERFFRGRRTATRLLGWGEQDRRLIWRGVVRLRRRQVQAADSCGLAEVTPRAAGHELVRSGYEPGCDIRGDTPGAGDSGGGDRRIFDYAGGGEGDVGTADVYRVLGPSRRAHFEEETLLGGSASGLAGCGLGRDRDLPDTSCERLRIL